MSQSIPVLSTTGEIQMRELIQNVIQWANDRNSILELTVTKEAPCVS